MSLNLAIKKLEINKMSKYKLLTAKDLAPFYILREEMLPKTPIIVICDHAGEAFPEKLNYLGISKEDRKRHITYDIGTRWIGEYIGEKLSAITLVANYSRLVVDVNRSIDRKDCMPEVSFGTYIPKNQNLTKEERQARIDEIYMPYQQAIQTTVDSFLSNEVKPILISIHSFAPVIDGEKRPWEMGILWSDEHSISKDVIKNLKNNNSKFSIGDNQPYSLKDGEDFNNTVKNQATSKGLPSLIVEFRQDMVDTEDSAKKMADILLESLVPLLKQHNLYKF